jgi:DNA-binding MarR family transcriptional regulator
LRRYAQTIRADLAANGYHDVPPTGSSLLGALSRGPRTPSQLAADLRWTKQALSRLADGLVEGGYATRRTDDQDRRRLLLQLTDRGRAAARVIGASTRRLDRELAGLLSPAERDALRSALGQFAAVTEDR